MRTPIKKDFYSVGKESESEIATTKLGKNLSTRRMKHVIVKLVLAIWLKGVKYVTII